MATQFAFGKIVTDGLVLALDAADRNSYPGSGTTWTDISGNGNTGTLTNGPTFNSANGGSIVCDGIDDYVNCGSSLNLDFGLGNFNVSCWIKTTNSSPSDYMGVISKYNTGTSTGLWIQLNPTNRYVTFGWDGSIFLISNTSVNNGIWRNISCQRTGVSTVEIYVDGILVSSGAGANKSSDSVTSLDVGRINISGRYFNGNIASTVLYNRALSASEVLQNYNAQKSRFNL
jgi:hypothetical protein